MKRKIFSAIKLFSEKLLWNIVIAQLTTSHQMIYCARWEHFAVTTSLHLAMTQNKVVILGYETRSVKNENMIPIAHSQVQWCWTMWCSKTVHALKIPMWGTNWQINMIKRSISGERTDIISVKNSNFPLQFTIYHISPQVSLACYGLDCTLNSVDPLMISIMARA